MLFLKVQKPKPSSKKQVHGENSSEGQKTVQVAGQVTNQVPHPGNQNWCRVDRTPVTPTLGACTDARVGWVTAPLTPHATQGTDMDAETRKGKASALATLT